LFIHCNLSCLGKPESPGYKRDRNPVPATDIACDTRLALLIIERGLGIRRAQQATLYDLRD
jgi:hypothetical protein